VVQFLEHRNHGCDLTDVACDNEIENCLTELKSARLPGHFLTHAICISLEPYDIALVAVKEPTLISDSVAIFIGCKFVGFPIIEEAPR
jgi:hypothetical protein